LDDSEDESTKKLQQKQQDPESNPLLTDLDFRDKETKRAHKAALWFEKDVFKNLENDDDAEYELDKMIELYKKKGGHVLGEEEKIQEKVDEEKKRKRKISENDTNSDYDMEEMMAPNKKLKKIGGKDGFEVVPKETGKEVFVWLHILLIEIINNY